ncbi:MAG: hypothetical protein R3B13_16410 [Polyangiaceae bacterium]
MKRFLLLTAATVAVVLASSTASAQHSPAPRAAEVAPGSRDTPGSTDAPGSTEAPGSTSAPTSSDTSRAEEHHAPTFVIGGLMFAIPYTAGVGYAAFHSDEPRGMEPNLLYVPVLGPLLAIRGVGCDDTGTTNCSTSGATGTWAVLAVDSVIQATGVALVLIDMTRSSKSAARSTPNRVSLVPRTIGTNAWGVTVLGDF